MELIRIGNTDADKIAPLVAAFRTQLKSCKGIKSQPDIEAGKEEILEFVESGFPVYAVEDSGILAGYIVCTMLFGKAEEIAASMGEDTVYNYVHPNNENMIRFLRSKGYTVLNMIEIRKPYKDEKLTEIIHVGKEAFDY